MNCNDFEALIQQIKAYISKNWTSEETKDLCVGCKYFESSWHLLVKSLYFLEDLQNERCNECEFYQGVHGVEGHAPCKLWRIGGVMWDDCCRRFHRHVEPKPVFGFESPFGFLNRESKEIMEREQNRFIGEDKK